MVVNWSPIGISSMVLFVILLIASYVGYTTYRRHKTKSLLYFFLALLSMSFTYLFATLTDFFVEIAFYQIHTLIFIPTILFLVLTVDYTLKERYSLTGLIPIAILGTLITYLTFQPESFMIIAGGEYSTIEWAGDLVIFGFLIQFFVILYFSIWATKIMLNIPYEIKLEGYYFLISIILIGPVELFLYIIQLWIPILIIAADAVVAVSLILLVILINRQPKLLFVLPFIPHRIIINQSRERLLFEHNWSKSQFNDVIFSEFVKSLQQIRKNYSDLVFPIDIPLKEGLLILYESEFLLIGLIVSKSSKFLRDLIKRFADELESRYLNLLKAGEPNPANYEGLENIFRDYFSIFPSRIIRDEKQQMFIAKKFLKLPREVQSKLLETMSEEDYEAIKCDLQRSGVEVPTEFIDLYEDLKEEMERAEKEKNKDLEDKK